MECDKSSVLVLSVFVVTFGHTRAFLLGQDCIASPPCTCAGQNVNCGNRSLVSIPMFRHVDISGYPFGTSGYHYYIYLNIYLNNNNLSIIQENAFVNISPPNVLPIYLYLQNNHISNLSDRCFNGIENVVDKLDLTNNKLQNLPRALGFLTYLQDLYLNKNPLVYLDSYTMSEIGRSLTNFEIDISNFSSWPVELHFLRRLSVLKLHSIPFSSLRYNAFNGLEESLRYLDIINSHLEELPVAVCHLRRLYDLNFEDNNNLSGNELRTEDCHLHLDSLQSIHLQNNGLVEFPNVIPSGFSSSISTLDLRHNNITLIQEKFIPVCRITSLYLDYNQLTRIPYALNRIDGLQRLQLGHNDILSIEKPDLEHLSSLSNLELEYNKIRYVSKQAFSKNALLRYIDLSNNYLKNIPEALASLQQVSSIYLEHNEIDCTCIDTALKSWNISRVNIKGLCKFGSESLQSFVDSHAPTCG